MKIPKQKLYLKKKNYPKKISALDQDLIVLPMSLPVILRVKPVVILGSMPGSGITDIRVPAKEKPSQLSGFPGFAG